MAIMLVSVALGQFGFAWLKKSAISSPFFFHPCRFPDGKAVAS
jgi:hypothetical protein